MKFWWKNKHRIEVLEDMVCEHEGKLMDHIAILHELKNLNKRCQSIQSQTDEIKRKFDVMQSRQVILMNKMENLKS
jgi:hypothetical protein